jgi:hypothetical protein
MFAMNLELYARPVRNLERYARSTLLVLCELYARLSLKSVNLPLSSLELRPFD